MHNQLMRRYEKEVKQNMSNIELLSELNVSRELGRKEAGPDVGLGKPGSCPGTSKTRGLPHMSCHLLLFGIQGLGGAVEATQGPPHV